jgi:hypothetical protein
VDGFPAPGRQYDHDIGVLPDHQAAGEILCGVIGNIRHDPGRDRMRRGIDQDGVAVGICPRHCADPERAARPDAVLDHDRLAQFDRKRLEHGARHHVGRAAGPDRNDRLDRSGRSSLGRQSLRPRRSGETERNGRNRRNMPVPRHDVCPPRDATTAAVTVSCGFAACRAPNRAIHRAAIGANKSSVRIRRDVNPCSCR